MNKTLIALAVSLGVAACGGSSSPVAPLADATVGGIWYGFNFNAQLGDSRELVGIGTEDGRFRFVESTSRSQFAGISSSVGNALSATGTALASPGGTWGDDSTATSLDMEGEVLDKESIEATWSLGSGETGNLGLLYSRLYEQDSSLDLPAGVWSSTDDAGLEIGTFTIDSAGLVTGQDVDGCQYAGNVSIIDPDYNVYDFNVVVSNCGALDGSFSGLSIMSTDVVANDCMSVAADDGTRSLTLALARLP